MDQRTLGAYDREAKAFAQDWHEQPQPSDLQAVVRQFFRPGQTADIGCGGGRDTAWLSDNGYSAIGFEPSKGLLAEARRRYPQLRFQQSGLPELNGIVDNSFTNVLCETVIMHLKSEAIVPSVQKLMAVLEPGGTLYLSWRVTEGADRRDDYGRLYTAFDSFLVFQALLPRNILLDEQVTSTSSSKMIHRVIARKS